MKALDEIYKIYRLLDRSDVKISAKKSSEFFQNLNSFFKASRFSITFNKYFLSRLHCFTVNFDEILPEFRDTSQNRQKYIQIRIKFARSCATFPEISEIIIAEIGFDAAENEPLKI